MTAIKKSPEIESIISHEDMKQDTKIRCSGISPLKSDNHSAVQKSSLDIEKTKFFQAISKGVSLLIQQYGYSRARATSLILEEIRQDDDHPTEEEVSLYLGCILLPLFGLKISAMGRFRCLRCT